MGKTAIAAGPHAHPTSEGKVTLMISPLIALHDEQVSQSQSEEHPEAYQKGGHIPRGIQTHGNGGEQ